MLEDLHGSMTVRVDILHLFGVTIGVLVLVQVLGGVQNHEFARWITRHLQLGPTRISGIHDGLL